MNQLTNTQNNLPQNVEELSRFVLVGREKLVAVRAEIRAIDKLGLADGVRRQKLEEAQMIAVFTIVFTTASINIKAGTIKAFVSVNGITNTQGKTSLKNALEKIEGVQMINIDMGQGSVEVGFNEPATDAGIMSCIENTGFTIG